MQRLLFFGALALLTGCIHHTPGSGIGGTGNNDEVVTGICLGGTDMHHGGAQGELSLRSAGLFGTNLPTANAPK